MKPQEKPLEQVTAFHSKSIWQPGSEGLTGFEVILGRQPRKFLEKCDSKLHAKLLEMLAVLTKNPVPIKEFDVRKVAGSDYTYRIRIGRIRTLYDVYWNEKRVEILVIDKRSDHTYK